MEKSICSECGAEIPINLDTCPECGCPVEKIDEEKRIEPSPNQKSGGKKAIGIRVFPIITAIIGLIIVFLGYSVINKTVSIDTYNAKFYSVSYAAFGGDFYTEIYGAVDTVADELNDINEGIEQVTETIGQATNVICSTIGFLILSIGLGTIGVSIIYIKKD